VTGGAAPPATGTGASPRRRRPRASLNREVILDAALRIAERDGLDGLTLQALGRELGAHTTAVYRHFRDKDELVLELIDALRAGSYGVHEPGPDWRADLRSIGGHIREHYLRHPRFAQAMSARSTRRAIEFANVELALDALGRAGLDDEDAVLYLRLFGNYVRAMAAHEAAVRDLDPGLKAKDDVRWQVDAAALDPAAYPGVTRLAASLLPMDDPRVFDLGLEMVLDAIEERGRIMRQATDR
jgi:AcrR family transcriptional regulator